jgi:outer membrane protein OmpA-like peptidoglycan-associated protein
MLVEHHPVSEIHNGGMTTAPLSSRRNSRIRRLRWRDRMTNQETMIMTTTHWMVVASALALSTPAIADDLKGEEKAGQQTGEQTGERALSNVYFGFDSAMPMGDLLMVANRLQCHPKETIVLDAYADPVGSNEYNAHLAKKRGEAVRDQFVEYGIDRDRIVIGVFGERGAKGAGANARDRRVEVRASAEPVATITERRQGNAVSVLTPEGNAPAVATP